MPIDIHTHVVPADFPRSVRGAVRGWRSMQAVDACLIRMFGETQLMIGTEYPFGFRERQPVECIRQATSDAAVQEMLLVGNARRFLNLQRSQA